MTKIYVEKIRSVDPPCAPALIAAHYTLSEHSRQLVRCKRYSAKERLSALLTLAETQQRLEDDYTFHAGCEMNKHPKYYPLSPS